MRQHKNKDMTLLSGFAALNKGVIQNCYSEVNLRGKYNLSGLCAKNTGRITNSVFQGKLKNGKKYNRSGLCMHQKGIMERSFWLKYKNNDKEAEKYTDWSLGIAKKAFSEDPVPDNVAAILSTWNMETIWFQQDGKFELYDNVHEIPAEEIIAIETVEDLMYFAENVNEGNNPINAVYRLMCDIDFGGKEWTPVGTDPDSAFAGSFDGNGYCIKNFTIDAKKHPYAGFFGCLAKSAVVANLTIDCVISGEGVYAAPLCSHNKGFICNCITRSKLSVSKYTGGCVSLNEGVISNTCALGKVYPPIIWWLPLGAIGLLTLLLVCCFVIYGNQEPPVEHFPPVIVDPNATETPDDITPDGTPTEQNATFIMNTEMSVSTGNYTGTIGLKCPSWSKKGFVATVRVKGSDLRAYGVDAPDEYYVVHKTGLIKPGYGVSTITIGALPNGTKLPAGTYEFSVVFEFYNIITNEKSVLNSTCPIVVTVK